MLRETWQSVGFGRASKQNKAAQRSAALPTVSDPQAVKAVEEWLLAYFSDQLGINPRLIDPNAPFSCYGMRSIQAACLVMDLADWLGCTLQPTIISEYPTIRALAHFAAYHAPNSCTR